MRLAIQQPSRRIATKLVTLIAIFALVAQPMYGLVAGYVAEAASATVSNETELLTALTGAETGDVLTVSQDITLTYRLELDKDVILRSAPGTKYTI